MKKFFSVVRTTALSVSVLIMAGIGFTSCLKDRHDQVETPVAALMAFNLSPDRSIGFSLSGSNLYKSPLDYTGYTGGYLSIYPGQRQVNAYNADYSGGNVLASSDGNFEVGKFYSVFLLGVDSSYKNVLVADNIDSLSASSGQAYIRYINGIPDSVSAPIVTVTANGSSVVSISAPYSSISDFTAIAPGEITIAAKNSAGIDVNRAITVEAKKVYTILLTGLPGSNETPVAIKYITNGTLEDSTVNTSGLGQRLSVN